jgi:hypothetical protein
MTGNDRQALRPARNAWGSPAQFSKDKPLLLKA